MKKLNITLSIFFLAIAGLFAQDATTEIETAGGAEMTFESEVVDYGTIDRYADGVRHFKFTNTGNEPLVITNAKGSCGCTVPSWPKAPINPGETGEIKVKYATDRLGPINKSVTVTSNVASKPNTVLRIKGNVIEKKTSPVKEEKAGPTAN